MTSYLQPRLPARGIKFIDDRSDQRRLVLDEDRAPPPLDVGKLMAKNDHGLVWHLGAAERAVVALLLGHWPNLATTSPAFHRVWNIPIRVQWQWLGG